MTVVSSADRCLLSVQGCVRFPPSDHVRQQLLAQMLPSPSPLALLVSETLQAPIEVPNANATCGFHSAIWNLKVSAFTVGSVGRT